MKNWFLISVVIIVLGFSAIYLVVQDSNSVADLAPSASPICENTKSPLTFCTEGNMDVLNPRRSVNYAKNVCIKRIDSTTRVYALPTSSGCPDGFKKIAKLVIGLPDGDEICYVSNSIAINGPKPPSCADGCKDGGVKLNTGVEYPMGYHSDADGGGRKYCCDINMERTCSNPQPIEPSPIPPREPPPK